MQQGGPIIYVLYMQLPMAISGPIIFPGDIADAIGWAHHICACGC